MLFAGIGEEGQQRLLASSAVIVGCGAIGAAAAGLLVRAGVGRVRILDRDFVEPSNLQRQTLFDEDDARTALPKAVAAERKLRGINSSVAVEGLVSDLNPRNAEELLRAGHNEIATVDPPDWANDASCWSSCLSTRITINRSDVHGTKHHPLLHCRCRLRSSRLL